MTKQGERMGMVRDHVLIRWSAKAFLRRGHLRGDLIMKMPIGRARERAPGRGSSRGVCCASRSESRSLWLKRRELRREWKTR